MNITFHRCTDGAYLDEDSFVVLCADGMKAFLLGRTPEKIRFYIKHKKPAGKGWRRVSFTGEWASSWYPLPGLRGLYAIPERGKRPPAPGSTPRLRQPYYEKLGIVNSWADAIFG